MEIHELSALDLAATLARGEVSAVDVLAHTQERMGGIGTEVGAFVHATPELARSQAEEADRLLAEARTGDSYGGLPPFLGVPCPIKDLNLPTSYDEVVTRFRKLQGERAVEVFN